MMQFQKTNLSAKFEPPMAALKNDILFPKHASDVTVMT